MPSKCKFEDEIHQFSKPNVENSPKLNPVDSNKFDSKSKPKAKSITPQRPNKQRSTDCCSKIYCFFQNKKT